MSKQSKNSNNSLALTTNELVKYVDHMITNNRYLAAKGVRPICMNIEGEAGLGKTSVVEQVAQTMNLQMVKLNLSQMEDIGDLVGFPIREFMLKYQEKDSDGKPVGNAVGKWVDENSYDYYIGQGWEPTGKNRTNNCVPEWLASLKPGKGVILLLDDYSRADNRFTQACMELIDRQSYGTWKLPADSHIILTSNPDDGDYFVTQLDPAQKTRFTTVKLKFDKECWAEWAENAGIDTRCINFILKHPELITESAKDKNSGFYVNARSSTTFFNAISSFKSFEPNLGMITNIGEGCVGPDFTNTFTIFINNKMDKLMSPEEMLTSKQDHKLVINRIIEDCKGEDGNYRADIAGILALRLINFATKYAKENPITADHITRLKLLCTTDDCFTSDLKYVIVKRLLGDSTETKKKFEKLMFDPNVAKMLVK